MTLRVALLAIAAAALLSACVTAPTPLQGSFAAITPQEAVDRDATGQLVRWGGRIVSVEPRPNSTCFEMLSIPLSEVGRPTTGRDVTGGRFIACRTGFYDPAVFEANREVTFTGRVGGYETRKIGGYDYRFPRVDAEVVYLWPVRERVDVVYADPWPWWGWW